MRTTALVEVHCTGRCGATSAAAGGESGRSGGGYGWGNSGIEREPLHQLSPPAVPGPLPGVWSVEMGYRVERVC
jgi:hypothetical protein